MTVTSPDFIPCITTGTSRQVDASIRTRVGSAEILVTVECRDRVAVQDVTWIEELATKKKNIGAAKTIAVAASGFSAEAARVARENAIDLRILDAITEEDINSWMPLIGIVHVFKDCELMGPPQVVFFAEPGDEPDEVAIPNATPSAQAIFCAPNEQTLSLNDIWLRADHQTKIFDKVPRNNRDYLNKLTLTSADGLQLCTPKGERRVKSITMPLRLRWKHETINLADAKIVRYKPAEPADPLPEQVLVEFETKQAGSKNLKLGVQLQQGDPRVHISAQIVPKGGHSQDEQGLPCPDPTKA